MRIIDIWIKKNGEKLSDGTPYITDEFDNVYLLQPVSRDYFAGNSNSVEHIAKVEPDKAKGGRLCYKSVSADAVRDLR